MRKSIFIVDKMSMKSVGAVAIICYIFCYLHRLGNLNSIRRVDSTRKLESNSQAALKLIKIISLFRRLFG